MYRERRRKRKKEREGKKKGEKRDKKSNLHRRYINVGRSVNIFLMEYLQMN